MSGKHLRTKEKSGTLPAAFAAGILIICMAIAAAAPRAADAPDVSTYMEAVDKPAESVIKTPVFVNEPGVFANDAQLNAVPAPEEMPDMPEEDGAEPDETDAVMLARLIWGEARGVSSVMEQAAVVWCVLNRVDDPRWPDTVSGVLTQTAQFAGYSPDYPATDEYKALAADVLSRREAEKAGRDAGRVLPPEYVYFSGDGRRNRFRTEYRGGARWDWSLRNPYEN